jgi:hypothetical protein
MSWLSVAFSRFGGGRVRFNSRELSGAFGDVGTDLPLLAGVVLASGMNAGWAFMLFGMMMIATGLVYGIPMPVQPLKVFAALVIANQIQPSVIAGGALAIALIMAFLTVFGAIEYLGKVIRKPVVRGIQLGLAITLGQIALVRYLPAEGASGWILAAGSIAILLVFLRSRSVPAGAIVVLIGALYAVLRGTPIGSFERFSQSMPVPSIPSPNDLWLGFVLLALPQVPLSIGNSMLATRQLAEDWFPERHISLRQIGTTYSCVNFVAALFGGIPVCHGSGGMAGHYAFGGRTGGSAIIYGAFYLALGLAFGFGFTHITGLFPLPVLGVILAFEAGALAIRARDVLPQSADTVIALVVAAVAVFLPYGFLIALIVGWLLSSILEWLPNRRTPQLVTEKI